MKRGLVLARVLLVDCLLLVMTQGWAVRAQLAPQQVRGTSGPADDTNVSMPDVFGSADLVSIDPATGAAKAALPMELPATRGGVGPRFGLDYNSNRTEGDAGVGWSLTLPVINHAGGSPAQAQEALPYEFTVGDMPLVRICTYSLQGNPCPPGEVGFPSWANGWEYYRLKISSGESRYFYDRSSDTWRVQLPGGNTQELRPVWWGGDYRLMVEWDAQGGIQSPNFVRYDWMLLNSSQNTAPQDVLTDVYWVPRAGATSWQEIQAQDFANHVHLSWEEGRNPADTRGPDPITQAQRSNFTEMQKEHPGAANGVIPWRVQPSLATALPHRSRGCRVGRGRTVGATAPLERL